MKKNLAVILAAFSLFLSACTDISSRTLQTTATTTESTTTVRSAEPEPTAEPEETMPQGDGTESYSTYTFSEANENFLKRTVFVGDSICLGVASYGLLDTSQVLAHGNVAARNITDFTFKFEDGESDYLTALVNVNPTIIVLSMGMNDINMTTKEEFCENYKTIITTIRTYLPKSKLIVLGITPVTADCDFVSNEKINEYDTALENAVSELSDRDTCYLDVRPELINTSGSLKTNYTSGDGVHLTDAAYYAILWEICNNAEWGG